MQNYKVWFEVVTVVLMKPSHLWDETLCHWMRSSWCSWAL